ncbi:FK506-binding protein 2A [Ameca splendens]|uniref:peptidylprolyl isomerase n=1 Tax=Ameca splendens TaxID=208324 RepID=A0ABV0YFE1_9TELE
MRLFLLVVVAALSLSPAAVSGADKKKLQIGIKKRVDNCPIKSRKGDVLNMHYTGKLEDGTEFDSSISRDRPFTFTLGTGQVIKGWDQGLLGMCEGEKRKLVIPAELGYGDRGRTFDVDMNGKEGCFEEVSVQDPRIAPALNGNHLTF